MARYWGRPIISARPTADMAGAIAAASDSLRAFCSSGGAASSSNRRDVTIVRR